MARPKKFETVEELQGLINEYFTWCDGRIEQVLTKDGELIDKHNPRPYTVEGLAVYLDMDRHTLQDYEKLPTHSLFHSTIKKAKARVLQNLQERALDGKNNAAITIFNLKNNFQFREKDYDDHGTNEINVKINYTD
jgi:hypothetical protein